MTNGPASPVCINSPLNACLPGRSYVTRSFAESRGKNKTHTMEKGIGKIKTYNILHERFIHVSYLYFMNDFIHVLYLYDTVYSCSCSAL